VTSDIETIPQAAKTLFDELFSEKVEGPDGESRTRLERFLLAVDRNAIAAEPTSATSASIKVISDIIFPRSNDNRLAPTVVINVKPGQQEDFVRKVVNLSGDGPIGPEHVLAALDEPEPSDDVVGVGTPVAPALDCGNVEADHTPYVKPDSLQGEPDGN